MHIFKSTIFRALCAIAIGYMLIEYPEDMRHGVIRAIGALFLTSGVIAWTNYLYTRKTVLNTELFDAEGNRLSPSTPFFPIAGTGSAILGVLLIVAPQVLEGILNIIFGAMIMLGAFGQFFTLMSARRYARIPVFYWLASSLLFIVGLIIILKPDFISETLTFFMQLCGWSFIAYAFFDVVISVQTLVFKRQFKKGNQAMMLKKAEEENGRLLNEE